MPTARAPARGALRLAAWVLLAAHPGCAETESAGEASKSPTRDGAAGFPAEVVDDSDARHRFVDAPTRIVSLVPSATETLLALGLRHRLVGRTDYDALPELAELPSVGGGLQPNLEVLVALKPDLVVRFEGESDRATADRLSDLGIPHFSIQPDGIADVQSSIARLGAITGTRGAADSILADIQQALDEVAMRVQHLPRRKVIYLMGGEPPWVAGPGTYIHELMVAGGADNVFGDLDGLYGPISLEELITREVDLILFSGDGVPPQLSAVERAPLPGWVEVPGPRLGEAARAIARLIHPGAFR